MTAEELTQLREVAQKAKDQNDQFSHGCLHNAMKPDVVLQLLDEINNWRSTMTAEELARLEAVAEICDNWGDGK